MTHPERGHRLLPEIPGPQTLAFPLRSFRDPRPGKVASCILWLWTALEWGALTSFACAHNTCYGSLSIWLPARSLLQVSQKHLPFFPRLQGQSLGAKCTTPANQMPHVRGQGGHASSQGQLLGLTTCATAHNLCFSAPAFALMLCCHCLESLHTF